MGEGCELLLMIQAQTPADALGPETHVKIKRAKNLEFELDAVTCPNHQNSHVIDWG